jgi:hypothetical protein
MIFEMHLRPLPLLQQLSSEQNEEGNVLRNFSISVFLSYFTFLCLFSPPATAAGAAVGKSLAS